MAGIEAETEKMWESFLLCECAGVGLVPFQHPCVCEVLQIRNRCSTPPSPCPGIRLSGGRESVFPGCGCEARQEELIMLGEPSDRNASHRETCSN